MFAQWQGPRIPHPESWNTGFTYTQIIQGSQEYPGACLIRIQDGAILATRDTVNALDYLQQHIEGVILPERENLEDTELESEIWAFLQEFDGKMPSGPPHYIIGGDA